MHKTFTLPAEPAAFNFESGALLGNRHCPPPGQLSPKTVQGWSRYMRRVNELPADQQAIVKAIGAAIRSSHQPGCRPIRLVRIIGHADFDTPRNPQREQQMSVERAQMVASWLKQHVGSAIAARITWETRGLGATQLKAPPTAEQNRRRNRRVEITLSAAATPPPCNLASFRVSNAQHIRTVQHCLNRALNARLAVTGVLEPRTREAVRAFQRQRGLPISGQLTQPTVAALLPVCSFCQIVPATISPFPPTYAEPLAPNTPLQDKLKLAVAAAVKKYGADLNTLAITIVKLAKVNDKFAMAQVNGARMHFSASLLKVAGIYAAFELRAAAERLVAAEPTKPQNDQELFKLLEDKFTKLILTRFKVMEGKGKISTCPKGPTALTDAALKPKYQTIFKLAKSGTRRVEFTDNFDKDLTAIAANPNSNAAPQRCVQAVGYAYIAGALESGGFFKSDTGLGVWLAGDFSFFKNAARCVDSDNDQKVANATTTNDLARLYTLLAARSLFGEPASCDRMLTILTSGGSWFSIKNDLSRHRATHHKVGHGLLKSGNRRVGVYSEGIIIENNTSKERFVVIWQDYSELVKSRHGFKPVAEIIENTI